MKFKYYTEYNVMRINWNENLLFENTWNATCWTERANSPKIPQTKTFLHSFSNNDNIKYHKTREESLILFRISRPPGVTAHHNLCKTTFVYKI